MQSKKRNASQPAVAAVARNRSRPPRRHRPPPHPQCAPRAQQAPRECECNDQLKATHTKRTLLNNASAAGPESAAAYAPNAATNTSASDTRAPPHMQHILRRTLDHKAAQQLRHKPRRGKPWRGVEERGRQRAPRATCRHAHGTPHRHVEIVKGHGRHAIAAPMQATPRRKTRTGRTIQTGQRPRQPHRHTPSPHRAMPAKRLHPVAGPTRYTAAGERHAAAPRPQIPLHGSSRRAGRRQPRAASSANATRA